MNTKIKILYIDDELTNLKLLAANFKNKFDVLTAENGLIGLEILKNEPEISVVLSDMKMPFMNGLEFIKKAKEKYKTIKYYILTGFDITDEIQEALNSQLIIKYYRKPFNMNEIEKSILEVIN
jgi:two-component system, response regulator, stage 0 sporulation protein F